MNPFKRPTTVVQAAPEPAPPATMPDTSSPGVIEARRRAEAQLVGRSGRTSTILTAPQDRGSAYTATKLGTSA